ncbi:MAG TPA: type II secretion system protein GspK [Fimbriimonas sp.]|nr:type II secretion system protein GspK [Fimbriimonas sp.]
MRNRRQRGAVFVVTLAVLTVLVAVVASAAVSEKVTIREEISRLEQRRAMVTAEAGIQRAAEVLADEGTTTTTNVNSNATLGSTANQAGATTLQDDWATLGNSGNDRFVLRNSSFRLQILDAAARININTAAQAQLQKLPLLPEQIDAILDWRSAGENARPDGAKDSYYNGLPNPYDASLQPFATVSELLDVRYFTPADLYDPPQNQTSTPLVNFPDGRTPTFAEIFTTDSSSQNVNQQGNNKQNLRNVNLNQLRRGQFASIAQQLFNARNNTTWAAVIRACPTMNTNQLRSLLNTYYVGNVNATGKINPNTASATVLQTIPNLTEDEAQSIVNQQSTGFTQLGDILNVPGMTNVRAAANFVDAFGIKSQNFIVRVIGTAGSTSVPLEAVVSVTPQNGTKTVKILRMERQPFSDMTGRWGWPSSTNNDVTLEAAF